MFRTSVYVTIFLIGAMFFKGTAQENLVLNPSFEDYINCPLRHTPENYTGDLIPHWSFPNRTASDYFNKCSKQGAGVPSNFAGYSNAFDGVAYAGAILSGSTFTHREYLQGELKKPLVKGKMYCVTFRYKLASGSRFAIDQIGLYFSKDKIYVKTKEELKLKPQLKEPVGIFLNNTKKWGTFCKVYKATGGEKYLEIGNFNSYENTNYVGIAKSPTGHSSTPYAYYYFDLVEVKELSNCDVCQCVPHNLEVAVVDSFYTGGYNPMTGEIDKKVNDGKIRIAVQGGTKPYKVVWNNGASDLDLQNLGAGNYKYTVSDAFNCIREGGVNFEPPKVKKSKVVDDLFSIKEGSAIVLDNIFFETGKTELLPKSFESLNSVAKFIIDRSIKKIEISGHTDNVGNPTYNQKLSEGRAKAVVDYLVSQGVNPDVLQYKGYGQTRPIDTNKTPEGRAKNRRVEFLLVKI